MSPIANEPRAPYALEPTAFPFPALAAMAGRAPLGGARETALACFVVARVVGSMVRRNSEGSIVTAASSVEGDLGTLADLSAEQCRSRVQGTKHWLGSAALALPIRQALLRAAEASLSGDRHAMKSALDSVITVTANHLEPAARLELGRLAQAVAP